MNVGEAITSFVLDLKDKDVSNHFHQNSQLSIQTKPTPLFPPRVARAPFWLNDPSKLARYLHSRGGLAWSPTAHVERPLFHRGGSVSMGNQPGHPSPLLLRRFIALSGPLLS
jgi:hypothetical protein